MNKNPFQTANTIKADNQNQPRINIFSRSDDFRPEDLCEPKQLTKKEKSIHLMNILKEKVVTLTDETIRMVTDPLLSETQKAATFLLAEKKSLFGEDNSEIYRLLDLLSSKKPHIALRAASVLEQKILNPEFRKVVVNYFKFNPDAKVNFNRLYKTLQQYESENN